ncbi:unnamed protein product [Durusdinium trenchii]|uniref:Uncharacterized protein n=2 Tax=Durusdinium trenchii TaxID=1381693 RepID=A0ABP0P3R5_9DINO
MTEHGTVHPSTQLGRIIEKHHDLRLCESEKEKKEVKFILNNMWTIASFSFVLGMREKCQETVVALVNKDMDGQRPLQDSILFQYEMPALGAAVWGSGSWSPKVLIIDLMGTCKQTSPALLEQVLLFVKAWDMEPSKKLEFVRQSSLSWKCIDCPAPRCNLDQRLADYVSKQKAGLTSTSWWRKHQRRPQHHGC